MLEVKNLDAFYGPIQVLHGIDLSLGAGEIVGLVGANAAGKSTLMFTLAGLRTTAPARFSSTANPLPIWRPMTACLSVSCSYRNAGVFSPS